MASTVRVLIAARHPPGGKLLIGGVQSWCLTVGEELIRLGHEVTFWGPHTRIDGMYDIGILANICDTRPALKMCLRHLTICHGIIPAEKSPVKDVAFTSEEVRDFWHGDGPIIRQPINLAFWRERSAEKRFLLRFSYREGLDFVPDIAKELGFEYLHIRNASQAEARDAINQSACVIASGRAACEVMACNVPVVICDDRTYQEPLLDTDTIGSMQRNYSGRGGIRPDRQNMRDAIQSAINDGGLRAHVERHHDVKKITEELLCLLC